MDKMEQGQIDVGFVGARDNSKKLEFRKLFEDTIVIIALCNYPAFVTLDDVKISLHYARTWIGNEKFFYSALKKQA